MIGGPVRQDGVVLSELGKRIRLLAVSVVSIALCAFSLVLFLLAILGIVLIIIWVGIPLLIAEVPIVRALAGEIGRAHV